MIFLLSILGWALVGVIVGFISTKFVDLRGDDPRLCVALAALAALAGGWVYSWVSGSPVVLFNAWTLLWAAVAAAVAATIWHVVRSRAPYHRPSVRRSY